MTLTTDLRVQAGKQTVWETAVAPSVALRGVTEFKVKPEQEIKVLNDLQLNMAGGDTSVILSNGGGGSVQGWASYEDLPYWWDALLGEATPGVGPGYSRAYAAPITTLPTPRIQTLMLGDETVGAYKLVGGILNEFTLKLEPKKEVIYTGAFIGNSVAAGALTGALATRTVIPIMASDVATLFLDTWAGTMGATALTKCFLRSLELSIKSNRSTRYCVGDLKAASYISKPWESTLKLRLEWNATSKAVIDEMVGGAAAKRQFEVNFSGGTNKTLKIQYAGTITEAPEIFEDDDGVVSVGLTLTRTYHGTFANWLKITHVNAVASLT